jgi:hypothetical protein
MLDMTDRATKVNWWQDIANEEILFNHDMVYDSLDPLVWQEVDLVELLYEDPETHDENNVYNEQGH